MELGSMRDVSEEHLQNVRSPIIFMPSGSVMDKSEEQP
jgi:hypothetical protein